MGFWDRVQWQWNLLWQRSLLQWEEEQVAALMVDLKEVHLSKFTNDKTWWHSNTKGEFSVNSFIKAWWSKNNKVPQRKAIWKCLTPPKEELLV